MIKEFLFGIRRFLIIASGGMTRYSDYPDFDKKVALERKRMDYEKEHFGRFLIGDEHIYFWKNSRIEL